MKLIFSLLLLVALGGAGYYYYLSTQNMPPSLTRLPTGINVITSGDAFSNNSVLGEAVSHVLDSGIHTLNNLTDGQAEPVINQTVSDLQERVKELPAAQYKKVKYEFCKDVLEEAE